MLLLKELIIILLLAVIIIIIASRLKIPSALGFLLTGVILGPSALGLIETTSDIEILAEIGIIILMFTIGLEFSISKIRNMKRAFFQLGGLQVAVGWLVFFFILLWQDYSVNQSFVIAFILVLSSTAIVLKILQDKDEIGTPVGLNSTGILLFQDAALIPFMLLLPSVNQFSGSFDMDFIYKMIVSIIGVIVVFILSKLFIPRVFTFIVKAKIPELLMVSVIVFIFSISFLTHYLGASLAMGAFIAGVAISDSQYAHQINTEILPSRHIFISIFFISIGMFVNIPFFMDNFLRILWITIFVIVIKLILIFIITILSRRPLNQAIALAFNLAHIGEFSLVILTLSEGYRLISYDTHQIILSVTVLSMFSIPLSMIAGKKFAGFDVFKKKIDQTEKPVSITNHTIIAGYGVNGQNISRVLKLLGIPYIIVDVNPENVSTYRAAGEPIYYADISHFENLMLLNIEKAALLVIAISDMNSAERTLGVVKMHNPGLKIVVRCNYVTQVKKMYKLGADLVLSQDMETSLVFIMHILKFYHMPDHIARIQTDLLRKKHYQFFMKKNIRDSWKLAIMEYIEKDNEMFFIGPNSRHVSQKIANLEPFKYDGMKIIGLIRQDKVINKGLEDMALDKFDTIIFAGNHQQVYKALMWMEDNN
ncbi:MAG: cation:proton antiporter [Calditrichaceae bacterium]|nr:cation:proton antiporter [Calditrichaceae bacterium]MBN2710145.1 cation:proton antiporter [Calditrichaceae bacterium]RQV95798.1 MAG: hypothetical protein EH224_06385 [Calditrichota bacterium]